MFMRTARHDEKVSVMADALSQHKAFSDALSQAIVLVRFTPDAMVTHANDNFARMMAYSSLELAGQLHKSLCTQAFADFHEYQMLWRNLRGGNTVRGTFDRVHKSGRIIWLGSTYFPITSGTGATESVVKIAYDVTEKHEQWQKLTALTNALDRSSAIILFEPDGTIKDANENFLNTVNYTLNQIIAKHHRLFCDDTFYKENPDFWDRLAQGKVESGLYRRLDANNNEVVGTNL